MTTTTCLFMLRNAISAYKSEFPLALKESLLEIGGLDKAPNCVKKVGCSFLFVLLSRHYTFGITSAKTLTAILAAKLRDKSRVHWHVSLHTGASNDSNRRHLLAFHRKRFQDQRTA